MGDPIRAGGAVTFLNRTYEEAIGLLLEARDYLAHQEARDRAGMPPSDRLLLSLETTRVTATLAHVVAWLLTQKAIHAGEIVREEAGAAEHRLGGRAVCLGGGLDGGGAPDARMPDGLRKLMSRSRNLYVRVSRLDELIRRSAD